MMTTTTTESYDRVLYPSYTHAQTHPDRLSVVAMLFGMQAAPVEGCRVLELGCGDGSNLVPMAFALPGSEFVGLDRAARPLLKGQNMVAALGLKNIELRQLDLLDVDDGLGQFDYIIAHGLYSWVPPPVQDKIVSICKALLKPQGVAYVSYNTYPGSHLRDMVRQMMFFHVRNFAEPQQRVEQAVALMKFLVEGRPFSDTYSQFLKEELDQALEHGLSHLYHDELADINSPVYFYQFMEHASQHGLQFLAEADFYEMQDYIYPPQTSATLHSMGESSIILREQYLDFLKCRRFRQTLLCHKDVALNREPHPELLMNLYMASPARPLSGAPDCKSQTVEEFHGPRGSKVATDYPLAKAALLHLGQIYPQLLHFTALLDQAASLVGQSGTAGDEVQALASILFHTYATGLLELYPRRPAYTSQAGERPTASPLARWQIQHDSVVTNLRHINIEVEDTLGQQLLRLLDGTRDREALLQELMKAVQSGQATLQQDGVPLSDPQRIREVLSGDLEKNLTKLAQFALLVA